MEITEFKEAEVISITEPTKERLKEKLDEYYEKYKNGYSISVIGITKKAPDGQYTLKIHVRKVIRKFAHNGKTSIPKKGGFEH